ncbi:MAG: methyltransferase, partial [bacterium]|nr:methyltransferase [bacterium]
MTRTRDSRTAFGLKILNSNHPGIRRLKREGHWPEIHGHKFWNSSFLIMNELKREPLPRGSRVMEIGCGWGLLGIYCAKQFGARVTGVDADKNVFPFLE